MRRVLVAIAVAGLFLGAAPGAASGGSCWKYTAKERAFKRAINEARGPLIPDLKFDRHLSRAAKKQTRAMIAEEELFHTKHLRRRITNWDVIGENVGVGSTVESLHQAFMASPGHLANIVHDGYRYVGISARKAHGRLWVTVIFEGQSDPGTRLKMPACD